MAYRISAFLRASNPPVISFPVSDIMVDIGTATALVYADGEFGRIEISTVIGERKAHQISHIRTLVARRRVDNEGQGSRWYAKMRIAEERDLAESGKLRAPDSLEADVAAIGQAAFERWGRDSQLDFVRPVRNGNVGDIEAYRSLLRHLIRVKYPEFKWNFEGASRMPRIFLGVPQNATQEHIQAIRTLVESDIKAQPVLVWEQTASAVGARLRNDAPIPFAGPKSVAIADLGGGTLDIAVLANGVVIDQKSYDTAGDELDEAIITYMARVHKLDIGYRTAIAIKEGIGSAIPLNEKDDNELHVVKGSSFKTQRPDECEITAREIRGSLQPVLDQIIRDFNRYLESLHGSARGSGDIHGDIKARGFYLTGGTALLKGLDEYLALKTGLKMQLVKNPMTSVIDGLVQMQGNADLLQMGLVPTAA